MYRRHFGLEEHPFSLTPDTHFFFNNQSHREVLSSLLLALRHCEGFIKVVGEVGTGKTLLSRKLLMSLGSQYLTAYIPNPYLTPDELKWFLAEEIGIPYSPDIPSYQLLRDINQRLVELAVQNRQVVLIVDEAQAMPRETMESLRLLTNLETEKNKLLQVVLFGQPELDEMLDRSDLRQLKQRIVFSEYLKGMSKQTVINYVDFRLVQAGYGVSSKTNAKFSSLFTPSAFSLLFQASAGIPRLVNVIAHKAMLAAYGEKSTKVTRRHLARAIEDTRESRSRGRWLAKTDFWIWPAVAAAATLSAVFLPGFIGLNL